MCAEKPEVNVALNIETTTIKVFEEKIMKVTFIIKFRTIDNKIKEQIKYINSNLDNLNCRNNNPLTFARER